MTFADVADQFEVDVLPDVWPAANLFVDLLTQWRVGTGGAVGLDYTAIPVVMDLRKVPDEKRGDLFDDLRVMECAALAEMRRK